jgi:parallel beta-helix repeat protein
MRKLITIMLTPFLIFSLYNAISTVAPSEISIDRPGIEIHRSVRIQPETYRVADTSDAGVLIVKADNITIDLNGAELVGSADGAAPDAFSGFGIVSDGHSNITIKNGKIRGFKVAVYVRGGANVVVEDCDVSHNYRMRLKSTPEREDASDWLWPHYNDQNEWMGRYGGGIVVEECTKAIVRRNRGHHSQNGILLDATSDSKVYDNDFSFNSGWGLAMWRSSRNEVSHNKFDWCVRGYSHGVYARGQDSAGILVFEQCNNNVFAYNSATHGGDGFFLYAGHETLQQTGEGGCNRNILYRNDFSHAVANGIEATFSDGNWFIENVLNDCNYGVWGGYSYNTWIVGNQIRDCSVAGIAIEHGHDNVIEANDLTRNPVGVQLWWNENASFLTTPYGQKQNTKSERHQILRNRFMEGPVAVSLKQTHQAQIWENAFINCKTQIQNEASAEISVQDSISAPQEAIGIHESRWSSEFQPPDASGALEAFLPEGARRGRQYILVDEWGPYDFSQAKIWPSTLHAGASGVLYLYGPESAFDVVDAPEGVSVEPMRGQISSTSAARLELRAMRPGLQVFSVGVRVAAENRTLQASGSLLNAVWRVQFFHWEKSKDPREDQGAWDELLKGGPVDEMELDAINFAWGGGSPSGRVNRDYFGTLATTRVELPGGDYEIRTVSDDGVRVWVDGKPVIDNWTWHGPTEDVGRFTVEPGEHDIRIEHFEIDGWAALSFRLTPSP